MVRLVLEHGVSQDIFDNDMVLLSKDDPNVSTHACYGMLLSANSAGVPCLWSVTGCATMLLFKTNVGDVSLHEWFAVQNDDARQELHALGFVDGHEGQQSLSVKFYLQLDTQKGNEMGNKR